MICKQSERELGERRFETSMITNNIRASIFCKHSQFSFCSTMRTIRYHGHQAVGPDLAVYLSIIEAPFLSQQCLRCLLSVLPQNIQTEFYPDLAVFFSEENPISPQTIFLVAELTGAVN